METEKSIRRRINVSTSVKGVHTFEVTIETSGYSEAETLAMSDSIVVQLDKRYPAVTGG